MQAGIDLCDDRIVYVDTDSCKFLGEADFSAYNADRIKECLQSGIYATDPAGVTHYAGVFEREPSMRRFCTLGAKKYAYEDENGELHITVSGVSKKEGAEELKKHGGLKAFRPGFVFENSGKTESVYNDRRIPTITNIDGHVVVITRNVVLRDVSYTLGLTDDYTLLLNASANSLNKAQQIWRNLQLK